MKRRSSLRFALLLLPILLGSGCINANYGRRSLYEPIGEGLLGRLRPGKSSLQDCLDRLGAPTNVWRIDDDGLAIAYGWRDQATWSLGASVRIVQFVNASITYGSDNQDLQGVVLFFDDDLRLRIVRRGKLLDISRQTRVRRSFRFRGARVPVQ